MEWIDVGIKERPGQIMWSQPCPKCDPTRKHKGRNSLSVHNEPGNRWWKCHNCGWSGNLDAKAKYEKVYKESKMPEQPRAFSIPVREYLEKRGISQTTAKNAGLYDASTKLSKVLGFPYFVGLSLVNVKFLNIKWKKGNKGPKWWQLKKELGTRIVPFGIDKVRLNNKEERGRTVVIITEGEWDKLTWDECGYKNAVSVPQGAPSVNSKKYKEEFAYLDDKYVKSIFDEVDIFIISTDNDEPGIKLRNLLGMNLGKDRCRFIQYPSGYKDINEVYMGNPEKNLPALGKDGVEECYKNVKAFPVKGIISPVQVLNELEIIRRDGFKPGLKCGVKEVDELFTVKPPHIGFVTGVPGSGKSTFIRWYLKELIKNNADKDIKWAMFTPENRPVSREYAKIIEALTGRYIKKGLRNSLDDEGFRKALRFVEKHFFLISPDRKNYESFGGIIKSDHVNTLDSIFKYIEYLKKTENIFGYVVDAWNKIEHEMPKYQSETTFISEQLDRLLDFNAFWDLHGTIIVHPTKIQTGKNGNYKMPTLYDIKGSSSWKEKADIGIITHRNKLKKRPDYEITDDMDEDEKYVIDKEAPTIIRTEKIRFDEIGREGQISLRMDRFGNFFVPGKKRDEGKADGEKAISDVIGDDNLPF